METEAALRADILQLRNEIDRASCATETNALEEARSTFLRILNDDYSNSYVFYVLCNIIIPLAVFFVFLLLYYSAKIINERILFHNLQRELKKSSIIASEIRKRRSIHILRKSARRRTMFAVLLKCIIGTTVLVALLSSRLLMEIVTRGWLQNLFLLPETNTDFSYINNNNNNNGGGFVELKEELFYGIISLFKMNLFKDVQTIFIFSTIGSGMMVFGFRLLRSASKDVELTCTECAASLSLLQGIDEQHTAKGQELIRDQLRELMMMFVDKGESQLLEVTKTWEDQENMDKNEITSNEKGNNEESHEEENEEEEKTNEKEKGEEEEEGKLE